MRTQQLLVLAGVMLASNFAIAAKLEHDDVPKRCWDACGSVVNKASECDARHDRDAAELDCICKWEPAKTQIPLCAACISQYEREHDHDDHDDDDDDDDDDFDDDNDALDIVHSCRFTTTSYNSAAATTMSGSTTGTTTTLTSASTTGSGGSGSGSNGNGSQGPSGSAGSASSPTPTNDAAAGLSASGALSMAALAGLMPLAWL